MTDFDTIWRTQDEIRTVVRSSAARLLPTGRKNAVVGECIWDLSYNQHRKAIELELTITLDDDTADSLSCQFPISADYDGVGRSGTKFVFYI